MSLYYLDNHRTGAQLDDMRRLEAAGICLFCPAQLHASPRVLHRGAHWTVTPNDFPYAGTSLHLLLVPDAHVHDLVDLPPAAQADFWHVLAWVREEYALSFYSLAARNGDCEYTGGTVRHVHVHLLQGDVDDPGHQPVRTKLSSRPQGPQRPQRSQDPHDHGRKPP